MKSNLIDALRRAQEEKSDTTLSDSGSFDTTQEEFAHPANQDMAGAGFSDDAAELELMSTTRGLAVNDIAEAPYVAADAEVAGETDEQLPAQFGETMASATVFLTGSDCVIPESGSLPSMPRLARRVPVLCLVLALVAGAGWQLFQRLDLRQEASALGAFGVPYQAGGAQQENARANEPVVRFRYLSGPLTVSENEAAQ
jgi:hypothetical protein